jgi:hypothetical protein
MVQALTRAYPLTAPPVSRFLSDEEEILSRRGTLKMMMMEQQVTAFWWLRVIGCEC